MKLRITNEGLAAQIREINGEGIVFTAIKMGNGELPANYKELTTLANPIANVGITSLVADEESGYVKIEGTFSNSGVADRFDWKEVGIFIEDPVDNSEELLYAYGHIGLEEGESAASIPAAGSEVYEIKLTYRVYIGEAEDISAIIAESSIYATKQELDDHAENQSNPHNVSKEQVGLGNVPNVDTDDQTPTVSIASTLAGLVQGDSLKTIVGKTAKAISSLISHMQDSVSHITSSERSTWNGKANASHTHSANDVTSGVLSLERGGSGVNQVRATTVISNVITAASGFTVTQAQFAWWGKVATIHIAFQKNNSSLSSGIHTLGTLKAGYRPRYVSPGNCNWDSNVSIGTDGAIKINSAIAANATFGVYATFVLGN